jgi:hypothetical protein
MISDISTWSRKPCNASTIRQERQQFQQLIIEHHVIHKFVVVNLLHYFGDLLQRRIHRGELR